MDLLKKEISGMPPFLYLKLLISFRFCLNLCVKMKIQTAGLFNLYTLWRENCRYTISIILLQIWITKFQGAAEQIQIKTTPYAPVQQKEKIPKERLYKCGDCEKAFMREEHLKRHTLVHTGHPMHSCEVPGCNKTYTNALRT